MVRVTSTYLLAHPRDYRQHCQTRSVVAFDLVKIKGIRVNAVVVYMLKSFYLVE